MKSDRVLFVWRFQPFHKGHLQVVDELLQKFGQVMIGIGSSSLRFASFKNPLNFLERKILILSALQNLGFHKYVKIVPIPDFATDQAWQNWIEKKFSPELVVSGNKRVNDIFANKALFLPQRYGQISATDLRDRLLKWGYLDIQKFVLPKQIALLQKLDLKQRLQKLVNQKKIPFVALKKYNF